MKKKLDAHSELFEFKFCDIKYPARPPMPAATMHNMTTIDGFILLFKQDPNKNFFYSKKISAKKTKKICFEFPIWQLRKRITI